MHSVLDINTFKITPSLEVSNQLQKINEQLLIMFQYENMINDKKQDLDLLVDKELQIKELVNAHTW